jgi:hypothetical protein
MRLIDGRYQLPLLPLLPLHSTVRTAARSRRPTRRRCDGCHPRDAHHPEGDPWDGRDPQRGHPDAVGAPRTGARARALSRPPAWAAGCQPTSRPALSGAQCRRADHARDRGGCGRAAPSDDLPRHNRGHRTTAAGHTQARPTDHRWDDRDLGARPARHPRGLGPRPVRANRRRQPREPRSRGLEGRDRWRC